MNRAEPKATIFVNDPPLQSERPKHRDYHGVHLSTLRQVYNGRTLSSYERRSRRSFARHDRMSFML
jgi:hypothetical protein